MKPYHSFQGFSLRGHLYACAARHAKLSIFTAEGFGLVQVSPHHLLPTLTLP